MKKRWVWFLSVTIWLLMDKIAKAMTIAVLKSFKRAGFTDEEISMFRKESFEQMMHSSWLTREIWGLGIIIHYGLPTYRWWRDN
jgi:hypothetical protein